MKIAFIDNKNTVIRLSELRTVEKAFRLLGYEVIFAKDHDNDKDRFSNFLKSEALYQNPDVVTSKPEARTYSTVAKILEISIFDFRSLMTRLVSSVSSRILQESEEQNETKDESDIGNYIDDWSANSLGSSISESGDKQE